MSKIGSSPSPPTFSRLHFSNTDWLSDEDDNDHHGGDNKPLPQSASHAMFLSSPPPESARSAGTTTDEAHAGMAMLQESYELVALRNYSKALDYLRQYLRRAREDNDVPAVGRAYRNIGVVYLRLQQPKRAIDFLSEGLEIARRFVTNGGGRRARASEAKTLMHVGIAYQQLGQLDVGLNYLRSAADMAENAGHGKLAGAAKEQMAEILCKTGKFAPAVTLHNEALDLALACNDHEGVTIAQQAKDETMRKWELHRLASKAVLSRR